MKVSDIMTKDAVVVKEETPLKEAAGILAKMHIHGMPVVEEGRKLIGIITESDFFMKDSSNIYLPTFLDFVSKGQVGEISSAETEKMKKITTVKDIMTYDCETVEPDLPVASLVYLFKEKNFNSFPVADAEKNLLGIVSIFDIIKLL
ncbi:MAG TPA: CBS domain-containing protein [Patescibacteria group bacterium]